MILKDPNSTKIDILGVGISAIDMDLALRAIEHWIDAAESNYVCATPAHSIMDAYHDPDFRSILNSSGLTTPTGISIE